MSPSVAPAAQRARAAVERALAGVRAFGKAKANESIGAWPQLVMGKSKKKHNIEVKTKEEWTIGEDGIVSTETGDYR